MQGLEASSKTVLMKGTKLPIFNDPTVEVAVINRLRTRSAGRRGLKTARDSGRSEARSGSDFSAHLLHYWIAVYDNQ